MTNAEIINQYNDNWEYPETYHKSDIEKMLDQARKDEAIRYAHWLKMNEKYVQRMNMNRLTEDQLYQLFKQSRQ